jgi:hypothetical protein
MPAAISPLPPKFTPTTRASEPAKPFGGNGSCERGNRRSSTWLTAMSWKYALEYGLEVSYSSRSPMRTSAVWSSCVIVPQPRTPYRTT